MAAENDILADGIKDAIIPAFAATPVVTATIGVVYAPEFDVEKFTDFRVDIWPMPYRDAGDVTREEFDMECMIAIVVAHRYQLPGKPPSEWIRERTDIVEKRVFMVVENIPHESISGFRFVDVKLVTYVDAEYLREHKVFWSEVWVTAKKLKS